MSVIGILDRLISHLTVDRGILVGDHHFLIIGSSTLYVMGYLSGYPNDIDIVLGKELWNMMVEKYGSVETTLGRKINLNLEIDCKTIELFDSVGFNFHFYGCYHDAHIVDKYHFIRPLDLMEWYYRFGREKDLEKAQIIKCQYTIKTPI